MPLYNNILLSKSKTSASNTSTSGVNTSTVTNSASLRFLQDHLLSKKRTKQQCNLAQNQAKGQQKHLTDKNQVITESALHKSVDGDWNLEDEYDPMVPNSYELLLTEHIKAEERRLVRIRSAKIDPSILGILDKLEGDDSDEDLHTTSNMGTAIAPPPSLNTINPSTVDSLNVTPAKSSLHTTESATDHLSPKLDGASAAAKIMSRMGYKAGQGLGRDEQGISSPLEVQKSADNSCWVIQKSNSQQQQPKQQEDKFVVAKNEKEAESEDKVSSLLKDSTRVLLLQNMVGPGEVDDDLETETKEECKKYGEVIKCLIYEIPNKRVPDNEAVRIFVEFKSVESAIKAVSDLNGRYFGGRVVRASFYDLERFRSYNLGS